MNYFGTLIQRERLQRDWSQEGLCKGICAVSYLSKIEQGKAVPSEEVLHLLLERLEISVDRETEAQAREVVNEAYEALFCGDFSRFHEVMAQAENGKYRYTSVGLDLLLLEQLTRRREQPEEEHRRDRKKSESLEGCMNSRQLALQRIHQKRFEEAIRLLPNAYTYYCAGADAYECGENYSVAVEYLQTCYDLASKDGAPYLMLLAKLLIGNCYCNQVDLENMTVHYRVAKRLAKALQDSNALEAIRYNTASGQIENGDFEEAYAYFSKLEHAGVMSLHKLAICCEKLGKKEEALEALRKAEQTEPEYPNKVLAEKMCEIVRYRLKHADYLEQETYGKLLLDCFEECRKKLPIGYAAFHLPWVLEWYTANRQYKRAYDLVNDFPVKYSIK